MMSRSGSSALLPSKHWGRRSLSSPSYRIEERRQRGFTLLELLVVLAILGLLIGLVGPRVMQQFGSAKEKVAQLSIGRLATALDMYKLCRDLSDGGARIAGAGDQAVRYRQLERALHDGRKGAGRPLGPALRLP